MQTYVISWLTCSVWILPLKDAQEKKSKVMGELSFFWAIGFLEFWFYKVVMWYCYYSLTGLTVLGWSHGGSINCPLRFHQQNCVYSLGGQKYGLCSTFYCSHDFNIFASLFKNNFWWLEFCLMNMLACLWSSSVFVACIFKCWTSLCAFCR